MSKSTERPTAVWRKRGDVLHTMECSNCGADAHYQIVDGVWRYEPYCAHCGARVYKQEDMPSGSVFERIYYKQDKRPRLAQLLKVQIDQSFRVGMSVNSYHVDKLGELWTDEGWIIDYTLANMINNPQLIRPVLTDKEEDNT